MQINKIDDDISVSPQIVSTDIPVIAQAGFKTIICNRPDGEESGQPIYSEIEDAAKEAGIKIIYQPLNGKQVTDEDANLFGNLLNSAEKPVFAYCRTGTRCTVLWCLANSEQLSMSEILAKASAAGYDMSGLAARL